MPSHNNAHMPLPNLRTCTSPVSVVKIITNKETKNENTQNQVLNVIELLVYQKQIRTPTVKSTS